ncbi:hypothetical protein EIP86_003004 [Pleurotus ostreatoroseus]|nr:hypothetical protein EIP86_003004 [Pleurotus ostreatoroseus]
MEVPNIEAVNDAYNNPLVEERFEKHELLEFKRLAAQLYKVHDIASQNNGHWEESNALSEQEELYKDTMVAASVSASMELATFETELKKRSQKETQKEHQEAVQLIMNPGWLANSSSPTYDAQLSPKPALSEIVKVKAGARCPVVVISAATADSEIGGKHFAWSHESV